MHTHILFWIQAGCEIKEKNPILLPKKWALTELPVCSWVAWSSWAGPGKLPPQDAALPQGCLTTGVPHLVWRRRLLRAPHPFYPGMKLNWSKILPWKSLPCFSTVHTAHLKPHEAIATLLLGTAKLAKSLNRPIHTEPPTPLMRLQQNPEQFLLCLCCSPAPQQCSPCSICLPRTNTFLGENAQEIPLVKQTLTGVSLGNTWHATSPIRFPFVNLSVELFQITLVGKW